MTENDIEKDTIQQYFIGKGRKQHFELKFFSFLFKRKHQDEKTIQEFHFSMKIYSFLDQEA